MQKHSEYSVLAVMIRIEVTPLLNSRVEVSLFCVKLLSVIALMMNHPKCAIKSIVNQNICGSLIVVGAIITTVSAMGMLLDSYLDE